MPTNADDAVRLAVTTGDPGGIGPEITLRAARDPPDGVEVLAVGDAEVMEKAAAVVEGPTVRAITDPADARFEPGTLDVLDLDNVDVGAHEWGELRESFGAASLAYVECAIDLAIEGTVGGIVTAPINKQATRLAGSEHAGHTGLLAARTDTTEYTMMLVEDDLRVTHVSTHVPLREACELVTEGRVHTTIRVTVAGLRDLGVSDPEIAVAGLNPHAGDGGLLGDEDGAEIAPAVERARADGIDATGPLPPDTVYADAARGEYDCVVSMYHDQGHIPLKLLGFDDGEVSGVNLTAGLPIVRTSVDHGTAFDIAGRGVASASSMTDALRTAATVARNRGLAGDGTGD
jgi:4-hydroxythreonine-4-phosphate dehydrogenase